MTTQFVVTGLFYQNSGYKWVNHFDIKRRGTVKEHPELMVVLMNPGSSYPLDGIENNSVAAEVHPDMTQQQIMRVMQAVGLEYARILNLSDLRTADSNALHQFLLSEASKTVAHSIFLTRRKAELDQLWVKEVPVIFAWGVNPALEPLANLAVAALAVDHPIGLLKPNTGCAYYHPLPRVQAKQRAWVEQISAQINQAGYRGNAVVDQ